MNISEVGKKYKIPPDTLRYYEKVGIISPVHRSESGIRDYNEQDLEVVSFVKCMRNAGLSIESLTKYMKLVSEGEDTNEERKEILVKQRGKLLKRIEEQQESLKVLDYKINFYETKMKDIEKKLKQK